MAFIKRIKNILSLGGWRLLIGRACYRVLRLVHSHLNKGIYLRLEFFFLLGYWPHVSSPRSFNEKILYKKIHGSSPLATRVADKWAVRQYVKDKGLSDILNEVFWVGDNPDDIPFDAFPDKFVIKATHGSTWNMIVRDKSKLDRKEVIAQCKKWLSLKYSDCANETHYDNIHPQIVVEKFIEDGSYDLPLDYKFWCFSGVVHYINVDQGRGKTHCVIFYDREWNEVSFKLQYPNGKTVRKPEKLKEMIEISEKLSQGFGFCRVDLYFLNNVSIKFGEITLAPGSGMNGFYPRKWDFKLGELWELEK